MDKRHEAVKALWEAIKRKKRNKREKIGGWTQKITPNAWKITR